MDITPLPGEGVLVGKDEYTVAQSGNRIEPVDRGLGGIEYMRVVTATPKAKTQSSGRGPVVEG